MENVERPLNIQQAAEFLGLASSTMYKMVMRGSIPSYRPNGGRVYFKREELEAWIFSNRRATRKELEDLALKTRRGHQ
jgi:excisionase family DNA binding protein